MDSKTVTPTCIMCVGMCVLDIIHVCEQFPEEDTDKRCLDGYWQRGGNASNNCTVLRQLGADCEFLGMTSQSPAFEFLLDDCRKRGIDISHCPSTTQDPPFSSVILVKAADTRTIIHSNSNFPILTYQHFKANVSSLKGYSWIHFEGRNPDETLHMIQDIHNYNASVAEEEQIRVSVELEKVRVEILVLAEKADFVFLGKDLAQHLGWSNANHAVRGLRQKYAAKRRPSIICTWGAQGSSCLDSNDNYIHLPPAPPAEIVDSLGAGDTFCAAVIYALSVKKLSLQEAVGFGNRCAGYKLSQRGYDALGAWHNINGSDS